MPKLTKRNTSTAGGAHVNQAGGPVVTGQNKIFDCSGENITAVCDELARNGVALQNASGATQRETLRLALEYRGPRGLNTYEGTAAGYMRLATRVKELKDTWDIYALKEDVVGPDGLLHRGVARYVLLGRRQDLCNPAPAQAQLALGAA
jgi:hypothetical protein